MNLPAEKIEPEEIGAQEPKGDPVSSSDSKVSAPSDSSVIQPALAESEQQIRDLLAKTRGQSLSKARILQPPQQVERKQLIRFSRLLQSDLFLAVLVLTVLNAFIYIRYSGSSVTALSLKEANAALKENVGDDYKYLEPVSDFLNYHGEFSSEDSPEFQSSLKRFREKIAFLGTDPSELFLSSEFFRKNQGLYWSKRLSQSVTDPTQAILDRK